ncbi:unnamed protein product [Adineta ricciae]|uniref:CRAL-TRIO domain-containing protein n=3 Tax=Adineta ricciae TaxID=249248 RepID=A0A814KQ88_ADIRI|nr:unnamed protein product [Adineta ricciae]
MKDFFLSTDNLFICYLKKSYLEMKEKTEKTFFSKLDLPNENKHVHLSLLAILRSVSRENTNIDPDEVNNVISCVIDNNQITIDVKTISPFKCVIGSAGQLQEDSQTAVIAIYGCWLPDRRLREYRYIMDQLFYYVYHQLDKLVTNDYILVYFHGATPKHRTPDFKILRKYYQMLNFRLRKNLRAVYVVHPTRWLRTLIAFSRPFFSNKFYHKVNYLFTIAELERQFPHNHIELPVVIEQTDWLYSQKYDRQNASIKRSIEQSRSRSASGIGNESVA